MKKETHIMKKSKRTINKGYRRKEGKIHNATALKERKIERKKWLNVERIVLGRGGGGVK